MSSCSVPPACADNALLVYSLKSQLCGTQPSSFPLSPDLDRRLCANREFTASEYVLGFLSLETPESSHFCGVQC